jgi:outer membrane protein assembly factor BamB
MKRSALIDADTAILGGAPLGAHTIIHGRIGFKKTVILTIFCVAMFFVAPFSLNADEADRILKETCIQGGLIVLVGCEDVSLIGELVKREGVLVHVLDKDPAKVDAVREYIDSLGCYGVASADVWNPPKLPYIDNLVNLIIDFEDDVYSSDQSLRVLAPRGVLYCPANEQVGMRMFYRGTRKGTDEWTHYLHGPDNNATANDQVVDEPFHIQWTGGPKWARHHNYLASTSAMVSSGGRMFAIVDEGPASTLNLSSQWSLVARDAYNGLVLWKRPIPLWEGQMRPFRSGPTDLPRRLVAKGDRVYATLGYGEPVVALDAATGEILHSYEGTEGATEIVLCDGSLHIVAGVVNADAMAEAAARRGASPPPRNKWIITFDAASGDLLWKIEGADVNAILPTTLCTDGTLLAFQNPRELICYDADSGELVWRADRLCRSQRMGWSTPTVVIKDGVILSADCEPTEGASGGDTLQWTPTQAPKRGDDSLGSLIAFSTEDGRELWRCLTSQGYNSPADVFIADGLVWCSSVSNITTDDFTVGRNLQTGRVEREIDTSTAFDAAHHHRCYRNKATDDFILLGRTGTAFIELDGAEEHLRNCWVRGGCQYGVMPCNGLLYTPPHSCACYIQSKLSGFWALAPRRESLFTTGNHEPENRTSRGPAFDAFLSNASATEASIDQWPTYRHDALRSGRTTQTVPTLLAPKWKAELDAKLTSPVCAEGTVLVAAPETHSVHALDAVDGTQRWTFRAGGRVDSPPTISAGLAIFGCADGSVYAVRLTDAELVWRFLAAPHDRRTVSYDQVESVWPVTGSVLVQDEVVYCTAGRSSYLDGGMRLYRLDLATGEELSRKQLYHRDPETGRQPEEIMEDVELPGFLPDVLHTDGQSLFLRDNRMDMLGNTLESNVPHMYSSVGFLDDSWWHRTYWIFGVHTYGRASGWAVAGNHLPSGRICVLDDSTMFGYGRKMIRSGDRGLTDTAFHLFRAEQETILPPNAKPIPNNNPAVTNNLAPTQVQYRWSSEIPMAVRAMLLAENALVIAGPEIDPTPDAEEPRFDDDRPGLLRTISIEDGETIGVCSLDSQPVFDGMITADGHVILTLMDGSVVCLGAKGRR